MILLFLNFHWFLVFFWSVVPLLLQRFYRFWPNNFVQTIYELLPKNAKLGHRTIPHWCLLHLSRRAHHHIFVHFYWRISQLMLFAQLSLSLFQRNMVSQPVFHDLFSQNISVNAVKGLTFSPKSPRSLTEPCIDLRDTAIAPLVQDHLRLNWWWEVRVVPWGWWW